MACLSLGFRKTTTATDKHRLGGLSNRGIFLTVLEAGKSKAMVLIDLVPDEGPLSVLLTIFVSCPCGLTLCVCVCVCVLVTQLCPTLCDPMDCSLSGFSVHGILQARILEWVAIPFPRGSS